MSVRTADHRVVRIEGGVRRERPDSLAVEEPLEIRVAGVPLAVTMRTPGNDFELAAGFLLTEGLVESPADIHRIAHCPDRAAGPDPNVVNVEAAVARPVRPRTFLTSSACGLCGKASIDEVAVRARYAVAEDPLTLSTSVLAPLPDRLRAAQRVFDRTGGLHAAGLFDEQGRLVCVREDVGRHNAFDKVVGWAALEGRLPLRSHVLLASGRASFELAQKALMAGVPVLASVSAPSTLAVELATSTGMTLVGFLRGETMNVYAGEHRIV